MILHVLPALLMLAVPGVAAQAPAAAAVPDRNAVIGRLAELRRIHAPNGIEVLEEVALGGTRQWVSIRGQDRRNPVLLVIHGGPGTPMLPLAWAYQTPWEDFFTVVQWDQRGVGKNAATADRDALTPTLSMERIVRDAEELTAWLRTRLDTDRVVVMGYSWGTLVGMALAQRRPEWVHAYVGVGQLGDGGGEAHVYARLIELATAAGDAAALGELRALAPYPGDTPAIEDMLVVRKWARRFNGGWYGKPDFDLLFALPEWAPEYTQADLEAQSGASRWFSRAVMARPLPRDPERRWSFAVPVVVIMGRHDLHTPWEPARAFVDRIDAPHKRFITIEHAAHVPMLERPGRFLLALIEDVLPLAKAPVR